MATRTNLQTRLLPQKHYNAAHEDMRASLYVAEEELDSALMMDSHLTVLELPALEGILSALRAVRYALEQSQRTECERCKVGGNS